MAYLLDTNILIDYLRGDKAAGDFIKGLEQSQAQAGISVITEYELLCGKDIESSDKKQIIEKLLSLFPSFNINSETAKIAAQFYRQYQLGIADALIAATACQINYTLATRNIKHFQAVKEIQSKSI